MSEFKGIPVTTAAPAPTRASGEKYVTPQGFTAIRDGMKAASGPGAAALAPVARKPSWLRAPMPAGHGFDTVKQVVPQLKSDGNIDRAWLGVSTSDAAPRDGALVQGVTGAPAEKAGLRQGDLILSFDGRTIATASDLGQAVLTRKPGDTVKVVVQRNGSRETVEVTLGTRPNEAQQG